MHTAIAITLFIAAATSAVGAFKNFHRGGRMSPRETFGAVVGVVLAAWFAFAGLWLLVKG